MSRRKQSDPEFLQHKAFQARVRARQKRTHEKYQLAFRRQQYAEATAEPTAKVKPPRNAIASVPNETPAVKLEGAAPPNNVEPTTQVGTSKAQALPAQHQDSTVAKLRALTADSAMANLMAAYEDSPVAKLIAVYEDSPVAKLIAAYKDSPVAKLMTAFEDSVRSSPVTKLMTALDDSIRSSPVTKLITQATASVYGGRRQHEDLERIAAPFEEFRRRQEDLERITAPFEEFRRQQEDLGRITAPFEEFRRQQEDLERITAPLRDVLTAVATADPEQESIAGGATRSSRWEPPPYPDVSLDPTAEIKVEMLAMQKRVSELEEQLHKATERSTPDAFPSKKRNSEPS
jgi:hypothetical protein